jgi:hypothetical protein
MSAASSSLSWTVTHRRSGSKPKPLVERSQAQGEVAEHLEEGQVPQGAPNGVEVVVLATGPHTLLHAHRARPRSRLVADEVRLERHHARHREQQGGIVRDQAGGRFVMMPTLNEVVDERAP